jgi:hypothetical protein
MVFTVRPVFFFAPDGAGVGNQTLGKLVKVKFNNWKKALETFKDHQEKQFHKNCISDILDMKQSLVKVTQSVDAQINAKYAEEIAANRKRIRPIIEAILFCGRQGIALRGHQDSGPLLIEEPDNNDGNFRAAIRLQARVQDDIRNILLTAPKNASYTSPTIQNDIIQSVNQIDNINGAKCFSFLADETRASDGREVLVLCARFVDIQTKKVREIFLQFEHVVDVTGSGLAKLILEKLEFYGIDVTKMRGQGYDGAAATSGVNNGVQAHITRVVKNAIYTHCLAHNLNLSISDSCDMYQIRNCMGTINKVYVFFNTPIRQDFLTRAIKLMSPDASYEKLKELCATRWVERHDSVDAFDQLYDAICCALSDIKQTRDKKSSTEANLLLAAIKDTEFIISLQVLHQVFSYTLHLCKMLQKEEIDIIMAITYTDDIVQELNKLNANADHEFNRLYGDIEKRAEKQGCILTRPRTCHRQIHRSNIVVDTDEQFWRITIYKPFISAVVSDLEKRFLKYRQNIKPFMCLLPQNPSCPPSDDDIKDILFLNETYSSDLECSNATIMAELKLFYRSLARLPNPPRSALCAMQHCDPDIFPNIFTLLIILVSLPVSTCRPERSFSNLKYLKNYIRSSTGDTRLNGLTLMYMYRNLIPTVDEIIDELSKKNRRLSFV